MKLTVIFSFVCLMLLLASCSPPKEDVYGHAFNEQREQLDLSPLPSDWNNSKVGNSIIWESPNVDTISLGRVKKEMLFDGDQVTMEKDYYIKKEDGEEAFIISCYRYDDSRAFTYSYEVIRDGEKFVNSPMSKTQFEKRLEAWKIIE